jgi:hypothetical protein
VLPQSYEIYQSAARNDFTQFFSDLDTFLKFYNYFDGQTDQKNVPLQNLMRVNWAALNVRDYRYYAQQTGICHVIVEALLN